MKQLLLLFILFFNGCFVHAQQDTSVVYRVFLVGDAGNDTMQGAVLQQLNRMVKGCDSCAVIFMGDNIYPRGFAKGTHPEQKLSAQISATDSSNAAVYFIPGNHDWLAQRRNGKKALYKQQLFVDSIIQKGGFYPKNGTPGPYSALIAPKLRLIVFDTQWWLQGYPFHTVSKKNGRPRDQYQSMLHSLDSLLTLASNNKEQVLLCAHHPLYTNGTHGGQRFKAAQWMFNYTPLQIFGLMGLNRLLSQEMTHPRYKKMRRDLLAVIAKHPGIIYASGHDHNLQAFQDKNKTKFIVSGSGSKRSPIRKRRFEAVYENGTERGFFILEYLKNGSVRVKVITETGLAKTIQGL